jgi:N-acyl-D-amino-acid deacylase
MGEKMKYILGVVVLLGLTACSAGVQDYDIVILNGRVMDPETDFDGIRNVGIKDGRIVTITEEAIAGTASIDATSHIVTAGFIDTHALERQIRHQDGDDGWRDFRYGLRTRCA